MRGDERDDDEPTDEVRMRLERIKASICEAIDYWSRQTKQDLEDCAGALDEAIGEAQRVVRELENMLDDGRP